MSSIRRATATGVLWSAGSRTGQQIAQFASTVVLARLLVPADFGLVAMIVVFSGFAQVFVDFGFGAALIQRKELEARHLSSAFWMNLAAGLVLTSVMAAAAPGIAALYGEPALVTLTLMLAPTFTLSSLTIVQSALLQRAMNFRRLAAIEVGAALIGAAVGVVAAVSGVGAGSLVISTVTATGFRGLFLWILTDWHPRLRFDRGAARELWRFSGSFAGYRAVTYWSQNADNLLVGRFVGTAGLGIYNRAYSTMLLPFNQVLAVISRVMFPALSRIQDDPVRVRRAYLRALGLVALVTFPLVIGLLVAAKPFILTLYGPKWAEAVPILQILCAAALIQSVTNTTAWLYQSQGRTDWLLRWGVVATVVTVAAFAIGVHWGIKGVAVGYVVRTVLLMNFSLFLSGRLFGVRPLAFIGAVRSVLAISLVMGAAVWLVGAALPADWPTGLVLLVQISTGAVVYCGLAHALLLGPYRDLRTLITDFRPGHRAREATA